MRRSGYESRREGLRRREEVRREEEVRSEEEAHRREEARRREERVAMARKRGVMDLSRVEMAMLRLYTDELYRPWNNALRGLDYHYQRDDDESLRNWATSLAVLCAALMKLRNSLRSTVDISVCVAAQLSTKSFFGDAPGRAAALWTPDESHCRSDATRR